MNKTRFFRTLVLAVALFAIASISSAQDAAAQNPANDRIVREVRHEILMQPYFDVFDFISFKVDGSKVILLGSVRKPTLKDDVGRVVKKIEGVETVDNQIEVLPLSPNDDRIRTRAYKAIYGFPAFRKYEMGTQKPIRIIVKNGNLTLMGVVDNEGDRNIANIRANGVSGVFKVDNQLQVVKN